MNREQFIDQVNRELADENRILKARLGKDGVIKKADKVSQKQLVALRGRVSRLESENADLRAEIETLRERPQPTLQIQGKKRRKGALAGLPRATPQEAAENRQRVNELKSEPCTDCGNTYAPRAMQYDHIADDKLAGVAAMVCGNLAWHLIEAEIAKCELVCANCHAIRTSSRQSQLLRCSIQ